MSFLCHPDDLKRVIANVVFFRLLVFILLTFRHVTQTYASSSLSFSLDFVCNLGFVHLQNLLILFLKLTISIWYGHLSHNCCHHWSLQIYAC